MAGPERTFRRTRPRPVRPLRRRPAPRSCNTAPTRSTHRWQRNGRRRVLHTDEQPSGLDEVAGADEVVGDDDDVGAVGFEAVGEREVASRTLGSRRPVVDELAQLRVVEPVALVVRYEHGSAAPASSMSSSSAAGESWAAAASSASSLPSPRNAALSNISLHAAPTCSTRRRARDRDQSGRGTPRARSRSARHQRRRGGRGRTAAPSGFPPLASTSRCIVVDAGGPPSHSTMSSWHSCCSSTPTGMTIDPCSRPRRATKPPAALRDRVGATSRSRAGRRVVARGFVPRDRDEMAHQAEGRVVGPVDVLDDQDRRAIARRVEEHATRREEES